MPLRKDFPIRKTTTLRNPVLTEEYKNTGNLLENYLRYCKVEVAFVLMTNSL